MSHSVTITFLRACVLAFMAGSFTWIGFVGWIRCLRRARLVEDTGTSTARAVAQGYVEVVGRQYAQPGQALQAPLTGTPCTWWRYKIEEKKRSYADGGRRKYWEVIEQATSTDPILFEDATGRLLVDPRGAEVEPAVKDCWHRKELLFSRPMAVLDVRGGHYRYTEERMHAGNRLYVAGELRSFAGHRHDDAYGQAVIDLLDRWKRDQGALIERFDCDRNGRIDADEWDAARMAAKAEVSARLQANAVPQQGDVLRKPGDGQPFLLSAISQRELAKKQRAGARFGLTLFAFGVAGLVAAIYFIRILWPLM